MRNARFARTALTVAGLATLAGCAQTEVVSHAAKQVVPVEPNLAAGAADPSDRPQTSADGVIGPYKLGEPYQVAGQWYHPQEDYSYTEVGYASWYGPNFHGKRTANGEVFDQNGMTAAHRTLPMPSWVRVTNLDNGRSVVLRVNDRGPFARDRIIDVSRAAARALGFEQDGVTQVRVTILAEESAALKQRTLAYHERGGPAAEPAPTTAVASAGLPEAGGGGVLVPVTQPAVVPVSDPPPPEPVVQASVPSAGGAALGDPVTPGPSDLWFVQAGAFRSIDNARSLGRELERFGNVLVIPAETDQGTLYRVRVGPFDSRGRASQGLAGIQAGGYPGAVVVPQDP